MHLLRTAPLRYLSLLLACWLAIFLATRGLLLASHWQEAGGFAPSVFIVGLLYDLGFLAYAALPLGLYLLLCPPSLWQRRGHRLMLGLLLLTSLFAMLFVATAEWLFWDEFGVRFNFIAVDYLVYSDEVLNNLLESYPLGLLLSGLGVLAALLALALRAPLSKALLAPLPSWRARGLGFGGLLLMAGLSLLLLDQDSPRGLGGNAYRHELASNGPYQFFAAFRNNELDYRQFYSTLPDSQIAPILRQELNEPTATFTGSDPLDIRRQIDNPGMPRKLNVVLVTIESLSAKYLGSFGDPRGLTPNLDALRQQSLFFNNFYATGTRTDRGLEAITLAIPPTPGRSIVKRIGRESGYASLGQQLSAQGYDSVFVYGGRGYFDNMNAFFSGNGYRVVDQSSVDEADIHFKNAWGMADEDLYAQAMKVADSDHAAGKPFFLQLMTTSNHRPYTYPDGRIDIASGDGREGAVKYTDYAIGQFLPQRAANPGSTTPCSYSSPTTAPVAPAWRTCRSPTTTFRCLSTRRSGCRHARTASWPARSTWRRPCWGCSILITSPPSSAAICSNPATTRHAWCSATTSTSACSTGTIWPFSARASTCAVTMTPWAPARNIGWIATTR